MVEESLRFESSSHHLDRWATEDREMHDAEVHHVGAFAEGRPAPEKGAGVGTRGNGGEARAQRSEHALPRDVSPVELKSRAPVAAFPTPDDCPPNRAKIRWHDLADVHAEAVAVEREVGLQLE